MGNARRHFESIGPDTANDRTILVRQFWSQTTSNSYHFEQTFSADFGKTWEPDFVADLKRL